MHLKNRTVRATQAVQFSVLRLHCPEVNSKAKDMENCRFTLPPSRKRLRLFRIIVSANQLSLYGAVAEMCEEYESLPERMGRPDMVMGSQSCSVPSRQKFLWKVMTQQIKIFYCNNMENELKSCHNKINGSRETQKLDPRWKLRPVVCMVNMETRLEFGL